MSATNTTQDYQYNNFMSLIIIETRVIDPWANNHPFFMMTKLIELFMHELEKSFEKAPP